MLLDGSDPLIRTRLETPLDPGKSRPQRPDPATDRPETVRLPTSFLDDYGSLLPGLAYRAGGTPPGPGLLDLSGLPTDFGRIRRLDGDHSRSQSSLLEVTRFGNGLVPLTGGRNHDGSVLNLGLLRAPGTTVKPTPTRSQTSQAGRHADRFEETVLQTAHRRLVGGVSSRVRRLGVRSGCDRERFRFLFGGGAGMQDPRTHLGIIRQHVGMHVDVGFIVMTHDRLETITPLRAQPLNGAFLPRTDRFRVLTRCRRMRRYNGQERVLVGPDTPPLPGLRRARRVGYERVVERLHFVNRFTEDRDGRSRTADVFASTWTTRSFREHESGRLPLSVRLPRIALDVDELESAHTESVDQRLARKR